MADMVKIVLEERNEKGKQAVKKLRPTGYVPAVFYGPEYRDAVTVKVKASDIAAVIRSGHWETVRFNASLPNGREEMCLMRNIHCPSTRPGSCRRAATSPLWRSAPWCATTLA